MQIVSRLLGKQSEGGKGGGGGQLLARFERDLRPPRATETAATGSKFDFNSENRTMFAHNIILPAHVFNALDRGDLINASQNYQDDSKRIIALVSIQQSIYRRYDMIHRSPRHPLNHDNKSPRKIVFVRLQTWTKYSRRGIRRCFRVDGARESPCIVVTTAKRCDYWHSPSVRRLFSSRSSRVHRQMWPRHGSVATRNCVDNALGQTVLNNPHSIY